jgi:hypothetical protein
MRTGPTLASLAALLLAGPAAAQSTSGQSGPGLANSAQVATEAAQILHSREANAKLMKQYSWNERLDFKVKGEVKDIRLDIVNVDADGKLLRTVVNDEHSSLPRGFLRQRAAEQHLKEREKTMAELRNLLHQYTLPSAGALRKFLDAATTTPDTDGQFILTAQSVVQPDDVLTVWMDAPTRRPLRVTVTTAFRGKSVDVTAVFATLPDGLTYVAYGEVSVPAKGYDLLIQNFNYQRHGP